MKFTTTIAELREAISQNPEVADPTEISATEKELRGSPNLEGFTREFIRAVRNPAETTEQTDRFVRCACVMMMWIGWVLRERVGEVDAVFQGIDEGEIEAMLREIRTGGTV